MSSRDLNDPHRAFERTLGEIFDRLGRLEARAWAGAIRTASSGEPFEAETPGAETALQLDVHRGKWGVVAVGEVASENVHPDAAYTLEAAVFEIGSTTPISDAEVDLSPVTIQPSATALTAFRFQAVLLGSVAAERAFTFALQVSSNVLGQPSWHNLKVVLLPS